MNRGPRNLVLWGIIALTLLVIFHLGRVDLGEQKMKEEAYSEFLLAVDAGAVEQVRINDRVLTVTLENGTTFKTVSPPDDPLLVERLKKQGVRFSSDKPKDESLGLTRYFLSWVPMLLLIGVWIFFMQRMQGGRGGLLGFIKSQGNSVVVEKPKIGFGDVAGIDEAKRELEEVVEFLKNPQKFQRLGGKIPKGVLLVGPPGTGKTLLARAVAGEADTPFLKHEGSGFVEMFVGVGASRVRNLFETAKKRPPCIVFIDEIDAVGRHRGAGLGGGNDEREQTLNQLLAEMDGFEKGHAIIVIAATNRPDILDPALLRPGRFDRQVVVPSPDVAGREKILKVHTRDKPLAENVSLKIIAQGTPGFSGADLENLANEAALIAGQRNRHAITMQDFEDAKDKVMMGLERRSLVMTDEEKKLTAFHEAGHAIVAKHVPGNDPVRKVTIIPRGRSLGVTLMFPERDKLSTKKDELVAKLATLLGGRIAEKLVFGEECVTTGAGMDIKMATNIAYQMVTVYGFSDKVGPISLDDSEQEIFLGKTVVQRKSVSEHTQRAIDEEIRRFVEEAQDKAESVLTKRGEEFKNLAEALLLYETLTGEEIDAAMRGEEIKRAEPEEEYGEEEESIFSDGGSPVPKIKTKPDKEDENVDEEEKPPIES